MLSQLESKSEEHIEVSSTDNREKIQPKDPAKEVEPIPLRREISDAKDFPVDSLGPVLGPCAEAIHETIQAPMGLCGQSLLAAATFSVQSYINVIRDGSVIPIANFFITIGSSGERKTAVEKVVLVPHREKEEQLIEQYQVQKKDYDLQLRAYSKAQAIATSGKASREELKEKFRNIGDEPEIPLLPNLLTEEPTFQGLYKALSGGQPSIGLFTSEGGIFLGSHGMKEEHKLQMITGLSKLWDGLRITRMRGGEDFSAIANKRLAIHLMLQNDLAQKKLLGDSQFLDQGFLSRFLISWPDSTIGARTYRSCDIQKEPRVLAYNQHTAKILANPLPMIDGKRNELNPRSLLISGEAKDLWIEFYNNIERKMRAGEPLCQIIGFANKIPEHVCRLAGTLSAYEDFNADSISVEVMERAIHLGEYYISEALRIKEAGYCDPNIILAERLLEWLDDWKHSKGSLVSLPDIYQMGPLSIRDKKTAKQILKILEEHLWVTKLDDKKVVNGHMRTEVWKIR